MGNPNGCLAERQWGGVKRRIVFLFFVCLSRFSSTPTSQKPSVWQSSVPRLTKQIGAIHVLGDVLDLSTGSIRGRRGSELKVLSAVETKMSGYFASVREMVSWLLQLGAHLPSGNVNVHVSSCPKRCRSVIRYLSYLSSKSFQTVLAQAAIR